MRATLSMVTAAALLVCTAQGRADGIGLGAHGAIGGSVGGINRVGGMAPARAGSVGDFGRGVSQRATSRSESLGERLEARGENARERTDVFVEKAESASVSASTTAHSRGEAAIETTGARGVTAVDATHGANGSLNLSDDSTKIAGSAAVASESKLTMPAAQAEANSSISTESGVSGGASGEASLKK